MHTLTIPAINVEKQYPSSWDEINSKNAVRIGEIMYLAFTREINYDAARKLAVDEFLDRVNKADKPLLDEKSLNYWANEAILADSVNFLFCHEVSRDKTETISINPKFCTQLIPRVKIGWRWYMAPESLLEKLTIFEFKEASWRVGKFAQTQNPDYLDELFAILYKKSGFFSGKKSMEMVTEVEFRHTMKLVNKVPVGVKFMNYLFFLGCMNWIREESIEIDGRDICFGCLFPKADTGSKGGGTSEADTGLAGILFQMAESGVFGNMEQTSRVSMWDVFLRLYQIHHQVKQIKQS